MESFVSYDGSCHCGAVTFTVAHEPPTEALSCNCSHCRRKGLLLEFVPADAFTLNSGDDALIDYQFNKRQIRHRICRHCGVQPFAEGAMPNGAQVRAVNLRAVPSIDLDSLTLKPVDGASF
jgi:hypothetical protein